MAKMLDTGYWLLDAGCGILVIRHWMLDVGYWEKGYL